MAKYGTTLEDLALIRVKAASYGQLNTKAVYRKPVTLDQLQDPGSFLGATVAAPLRAGDCCANADGSSCVIVACEEKARAFSKKPIWIKGIGAATAPVNMAGRDKLYGLSVAEQAGMQAYKMAGITAADIDVAEVHDCFTIAEMMAYENLGFAKPGEGKDLITFQGKPTRMAVSRSTSMAVCSPRAIPSGRQAVPRSEPSSCSSGERPGKSR